MPVDVHKFLHIQLLPAVLGGMFGIVAVLLIMTYLLDVYTVQPFVRPGFCKISSTVCFVLVKKKKKGVRRFSYHKPMNWLRYSILALTVVTTALGFSGLCLLLDPYSNFGRIAANLFRPAVMWGNNVLADWLMKMDNYSLFHVTISTVSIAGLISAIVALVVFIVMVIFRGRLFCNTLCPVGALLSLVSRYSQMRISFDKGSLQPLRQLRTNLQGGSYQCKRDDGRLFALRGLLQLRFFLFQRRIAIPFQTGFP